MKNISTRALFALSAMMFVNPWPMDAQAAKQQERIGATFQKPAKAARPAKAAKSRKAAKTRKAVVSEDPAYEAFASGKYLSALKLAKAASKKGEKQAFTLVGRIYGGGLGVPRDLIKAAQWYAGGAERGDADAQFSLAVQLMAGRGIKRDRKQAVSLFTAAAVQGHALAQYNLGLAHAAGTGTTVDMKKAAQWFKKAADQNEARAQYDLGSLYRAGQGVKKDLPGAALWIGRAADQGLTVAELEYGLMLYLGKGVTRDEKAGAALLMRAAQKGNPVAQNRIAKLYAHGLVYEQDLVEAAKWHMLARGNGMADFRLDLAVTRLSKQQRAQAQAKVAAFRKSNH